MRQMTSDKGLRCPQGHGLEVIEKGPQTLSARLGFASEDRPNTGRHLCGQVGQENENRSLLQGEHHRSDLGAPADPSRGGGIPVLMRWSGSWRVGCQDGSRDRPEGRRLFDMLRAGDALVVRWVDRLGRNYADVTDTIREFIRRGVIVRTVINGLTFDGATKDPMQQAVRDSLIAFMAATAQIPTSPIFPDAML